MSMTTKLYVKWDICSHKFWQCLIPPVILHKSKFNIILNFSTNFNEQFHDFTNLKLYLPLKMLQEWRMLLYPCCIYIKLTCNFKEMYHTTLCPTKTQWVYRWREKAYSTDKGYNVFYAHFPSTGTIQFPGVGQHVACKRKMNTRGVSIFQVFYYLLYESSTDIEFYFYTLYTL